MHDRFLRNLAFYFRNSTKNHPDLVVAARW
ncbi:hypothetical protein EV184_1097 [Sinorhizobium americanum]|uniref:Uncharacterized protein n=1 Tax=Sinorhizobium americanum TaxID=194963 RepID=A0A4R2BSH2_9HYPH|nr:hypothetical protein EV184_1097 [Sinorhizobium americanum]